MVVLVYVIAGFAWLLTYGSALLLPAAPLVFWKIRAKKPLGVYAVLCLAVGFCSLMSSFSILGSSRHWQKTHEQYRLVYFTNESTVNVYPREFEMDGKQYALTNIDFEKHAALRQGEAAAGMRNTSRGNLWAFVPRLPPWFKWLDATPAYQYVLYALENDGGFEMYCIPGRGAYCRPEDKKAAEKRYAASQ